MITGYSAYTVINKITTGLCILILLNFIRCDEEKPTPATPETEQQRVRKFLTTGTWKFESLAIDGQRENDLYPNLTIKFTDTGFTSTNGSPVWPASGTWQFSNEQATKINRGDNIELTITSVTANIFQFKLTWGLTIFDDGRNEALAGLHVFTMRK
jgi:hypothetical protein